jgi:hypothetical protein
MYALNQDKIFIDESDDQVIAINFATGIYYSFDKLSSAVVNDLINGTAPDSILTGLRCLDNCPDDIEDRLSGFIKKLQEIELIVAATENSGTSQHVYANTITDDGYEFTFDKFEDVADLLLVDPIHEINADLGWPAKSNQD